jgi:hypothetical protein
MSAWRLPGTSGPAALKSATENSSPPANGADAPGCDLTAEQKSTLSDAVGLERALTLTPIGCVVATLSFLAARHAYPDEYAG